MAGPWVARRGSALLQQDVVQLAGEHSVERLLTNFVLAGGMAARRPSDAAWLERIALAHTVGDDVLARADAQGPPSDQELEQWTSTRWLTVDRPRAHRVVHAVVLIPSGANAEVEQRARGLAERVHEAVQGAPSSEDFKNKAAEVQGAGEVQIKVEELEPVTADGRVVRLGAKAGASAATYDPAFAAAAAALQAVGDTSPVVHSAFGYHVLRLVEVTPELRLGPAERRFLALGDVRSARAKQILNDWLAAARRDVSVEIERSAEEATARVQVE